MTTPMYALGLFFFMWAGYGIARHEMFGPQMIAGATALAVVCIVHRRRKP